MGKVMLARVCAVLALVTPLSSCGADPEGAEGRASRKGHVGGSAISRPLR